MLFPVCCIGWTYKYPCNCQGDKCEYHRSNKSKGLSKKSWNQDEQFRTEKGWYSTESSSVKLCLDVSMSQHIYRSFCFVTFVNIFWEKNNFCLLH